MPNALTVDRLVINFNHPNLFEAALQIDFTTHQRQASELLFPIAAYSEQSGSLTNEDGLVQHCDKAVAKNSPPPTILEWLQKVNL